MNRIDRLSAILIHLQSKKVVTAKEIAERFSISIRTVYRDIGALNEAGVPIGSEAGIGYFLQEGYHLPPVMFTRAEAGALLIAGKLFEKHADASIATAYESGLYKIISVLRGVDKEYLESIESKVEVLKFVPAKGNNNYFSDILRAISENKRIEIQYLSPYQNEETTRIIEPVCILHYSMNWHLIAYCRLRKAMRDFRLSRIQKLKILDITFTPRSQRLPHDYFIQLMESQSLTRVELSLPESYLHIIEQIRYNYGFVEETRQGEKVVMVFLVNSLDYIARWVLTLEGKAEIISPPELRTIVDQHLQKLVTSYTNHIK